jgi:hypothetical protein
VSQLLFKKDFFFLAEKETMVKVTRNGGALLEDEGIVWSSGSNGMFLPGKLLAECRCPGWKK